MAFRHPTGLRVSCGPLISSPPPSPPVSVSATSDKDTSHDSLAIRVTRCQISAPPKCEAAVTRRSLGAAAAVAVLAAPDWWGSVAAAWADEEPSLEFEKRKNLPLEELKKIIAGDIRDGQYFVTGNLTRSIYREDCRFKDPTNLTVGVQRYLDALGILFDPEHSKHELIDISVTSDGGGTPAVVANWQLGGYLKFPWRPRVVPFSGSTRYEFDSEGLITLHDEKWNISPVTALLETITPTFGPQQLL